MKKRLGEELNAGHVGAREMDHLLDLAWHNPHRTFWELGKMAMPGS